MLFFQKTMYSTNTLTLNLMASLECSESGVIACVLTNASCDKFAHVSLALVVHFNWEYCRMNGFTFFF